MLLTALAPAKINLYLHVVGKRPDGYHLLESLIAFTDICDRVTVAPAQGLTLTLEGEYAKVLDPKQDNIVLKAARALAAYAGIEPHAKITLHKEIPVGAGLGGGSSDAAQVLKLLVELWQVDIPEPELFAIALSLGADVPIMLAGRTAFVSGIGEVITPVKQPFHVPILLVNPGVVLATAEVFHKGVAAFHRAENNRDIDMPIIAFLQQRGNDLQAPATALQPLICEVIAAISSQEGCQLSRMSGSGATCFGLFDTIESARRAAEVIQQENPHWWVRLSKKK